MVGVVFSIILVALTLTSPQSGPRMLRNSIRDRGTRWTLGAFVATFAYAMLDLVAVGSGPYGDFVPHISITVVLALTMADVGVLIYFIHHTAVMIQLPQVIASIAKDLNAAVGHESRTRVVGEPAPEAGLLEGLIDRGGRAVAAPESGYL